MKQSAANGLPAADRELLNIIQTGFPVTSRPYAAVGEQLGISENEVIDRIAALKESGIIRRIGGIFDSAKLGFSSTLVAVKSEEDALEEVAGRISAHPGVTHNYRREHEFNLWFTLVTESPQQMDEFLSETARMPGVLKLRNLPAIRLFKIGVNFDMQGNEDETD
jgi:siroheme decarboxylase